jgi:hypothetical protein
MRNSPALLVSQGMLLGVALTVDVVIWHRAFTGPRAQRRGHVAAAIVFLILFLFVLITLLIPL